ncbi:outer membrane protein assembly factor BamA [Sulfuriferula sp. AH1]|uniref:outer membrane protein assembly factor BamA n=1 Tax=Sulfuriferula sp. AH1 TaxID=1985873 RepID=UPI000B3B484E|nr:outer membrane protein assembly factor BamA [Sulfuriferula sp. AH1]ARU31030.1 outer membrane protein assembly factor BamA [Sulfuriferula sp. AH1]
MQNKIAIALVTSVWAMSAHAVGSFVVKDIRVEGIQRTEAGTVFSYLPVKVGDTLDAEKSAAAIKALYATGFFKDVRLEEQNGVLIVAVEERPAIARIDIIGSKEFTADQIKDGLKQSGLAEGRIFDKAMLDRASQEIKRLYFSHGKYAVEIETTITPMERNRVAITFNVKDGDVAKIRDINIVGNKAFSGKKLRDLFQLRTPGWFTWYTKNDQYSKQKLAADLETLKSFYLNQGYLEFNIDSTQVSITPDKHDIYLTVNLTEGEKYTVTDVKLAGEMIVPAAELQKLISIKPGDTFSREQITESAKKIGDRLGNDGYAFANVNAVPEVDKNKHTVAFTFFVDAGRRVYVNRININGNTRTRDEVVRREFRQMEGGWYAADKIQRSRERVERLGYFSDINVETPPVPGTTDQVDVDMTVTEKPTGNIMVGAGFSSSEGLILSGSISQNNLFGSGNALTARINSGGVNKIYSISYTNPYFTPDGLSLGYDLYRRDTDTSRLTTISSYKNSTVGAGVRLGIPLNEKDALSLGLAYERFTLTVDPATSPIQYVNFVNQYGNTNDTLRTDLGWSRDSRDSLTYPTKGMLQRIYGEVGVPPGSLKYYKINYQQQWFKPLSKNFTLMLNGEIGVGDGYGGQGLPFFKNFYAGGVSSVRGYDTATIGPKYLDQYGNVVSAGGTQRVVANAEILFPMPGMGNDKSVRLSAFFDAGEVAGPGDYLGRYSNFSFQDLRYSTGLAVNWISPVGPLKFSLAQPLNPQTDDKKQVFQFTLGQVF